MTLSASRDRGAAPTMEGGYRPMGTWPGAIIRRRRTSIAYAAASIETPRYALPSAVIARNACSIVAAPALAMNCVGVVSANILPR
jgi:hypothetical protein